MNLKHKRRLLAALAVAVSIAAAAPASAYQIRYQDWSRVGDNSAGAVFRPNGDKFQVWDNNRDGVPVTLAWNYKGVNDHWKYLSPQDGAQHTFNLNLSETHHVYFYVSSAYGAPPYISEYRTNGS
jgi:hypothetical protein